MTEFRLLSQRLFRALECPTLWFLIFYTTESAWVGVNYNAVNDIQSPWCITIDRERLQVDHDTTTVRRHMRDTVRSF